jgi:hypothetical protein
LTERYLQPPVQVTTSVFHTQPRIICAPQHLHNHLRAHQGVSREGKMVKADLTRDYYGDLELAPSADVVEIKKQFKKLGM